MQRLRVTWAFAHCVRAMGGPGPTSRSRRVARRSPAYPWKTNRSYSRTPACWVPRSDYCVRSKLTVTRRPALSLTVLTWVGSP